MALRYDENMYRKFYQFAVKNIDDIVIGRRYYTNTYPESFVVEKLLTNRENYDRRNIPEWLRTGNLDEVSWILYEGKYGYDTESLQDRNVPENSYNPWMLFETPEIRDVCLKMMPVEVYTSEEEQDMEEMFDMYDM